jgi:hypothetical protein
MARFPQYLSQPYQVLFWEPDDIAIFMSFVTLAMIYDGVFWVLPFAVPWGYGRVKRNHPRGFFRHVLFFGGLQQFKGYPEFFQKNFYE